MGPATIGLILRSAGLSTLIYYDSAIKHASPMIWLLCILGKPLKLLVLTLNDKRNAYSFVVSVCPYLSIIVEFLYDFLGFIRLLFFTIHIVF